MGVTARNHPQVITVPRWSWQPGFPTAMLRKAMPETIPEFNIKMGAKETIKIYGFGVSYVFALP